MSSISPIATKEFAKKLNGMGVKVLDAPVSGGQVGAENATLSIMVGGPADVFDQIKPYFEVMGKKIVHIGDNGAGQTCKVANQIAVALTIEAVGEALLFASKAGADPGKVKRSFNGRSCTKSNPRITWRPYDKTNLCSWLPHKITSERLKSGICEERSELNLSLPGTAIAQELFKCCRSTLWK